MENFKEKLHTFWRYIKITIIILFGSSVAITILYRFINPPITILMVQRVFEKWGDGKKAILDKEWKDLNEISPNIPLALIASEDQKFTEHWGFDFEAIQLAIKNNDNPNRKSYKGASTITQQVAKNVFLWSNRSWVRKGFETYFTVLIEILWDKKRIMEVYVNIIETGDGLYGVEVVSQKHFQRSAKKISKSQAALIAATIPNPRKYSVSKPSSYIKKRQKWVLKNMNNLGEIKL
jgi:monofunctional biosynthetic peptidoglycan transglycosylase